MAPSAHTQRPASSEKLPEKDRLFEVSQWTRLGYLGIDIWVEWAPINGYRSRALGSNILNGLPPCVRGERPRER